MSGPDSHTLWHALVSLERRISQGVALVLGSCPWLLSVHTCALARQGYAARGAAIELAAAAGGAPARRGRPCRRLGRIRWPWASARGGRCRAGRQWACLCSWRMLWPWPPGWRRSAPCSAGLPRIPTGGCLSGSRRGNWQCGGHSAWPWRAAWRTCLCADRRPRRQPPPCRQRRRRPCARRQGQGRPACRKQAHVPARAARLGLARGRDAAAPAHLPHGALLGQDGPPCRPCAPSLSPVMFCACPTWVRDRCTGQLKCDSEAVSLYGETRERESRHVALSCMCAGAAYKRVLSSVHDSSRGFAGCALALST